MESFLGREVRLVRAVIARDLSASLYPALLFMVSASIVSASPGGRILAALAKGTLYFSLYLYCFCMSNQISGLAEDRINKPDRPLVTGALDLPGAWRRWIIAMVLFPVVGLALGGVRLAGWALLWEVVLIGYNFLGLDRHWFNKNVVFISVGTVAILAPAWQLAATGDTIPWTWVLSVSLSFGVTLQLQDLRDVEGDRRVGRKTLPLDVGDAPARWITAGCIGVLLPAAMHVVMAVQTTPAALWEGALLALNLVVAVRTLRRRSAASDHRTYKLHTYWFCLVLLSPGILHLLASRP